MALKAPARYRQSSVVGMMAVERGSHDAPRAPACARERGAGRVVGWAWAPAGREPRTGQRMGQAAFADDLGVSQRRR